MSVFACFEQGAPDTLAIMEVRECKLARDRGWRLRTRRRSGQPRAASSLAAAAFLRSGCSTARDTEGSHERALPNHFGIPRSISCEGQRGLCGDDLTCAPSGKGAQLAVSCTRSVCGLPVRTNWRAEEIASGRETRASDGASLQDPM
jgi:hypothetical protein